MATANNLTVKIGLDPASVAALETLLAEIAFHATAVQKALTQYRLTTAPSSTTTERDGTWHG